MLSCVPLFFKCESNLKKNNKQDFKQLIYFNSNNDYKNKKQELNIFKLAASKMRNIVGGCQFVNSLFPLI